MSTTATQLPITETIAPATEAELIDIVRDAYTTGTHIYPIGGNTSPDFGLPPKKPGIGLATTHLARVIDYPARDMTITVESGISMDALSKTLAKNGQRLPIDAPHPATNTLGGVVATNTSGPRRYGHGTMRDYLIGIAAVDGRGKPFKGGGRVVKNVAGYDFCKLLVGSLGTLGVITHLTFKIKPLPEHTAFVVCDLSELARADAILAALVTSKVTPAAIEILLGNPWMGVASFETQLPPPAVRVLVALEGTAVEVNWMIDQLHKEWREQGVTAIRGVPEDQTEDVWERLREFPVFGFAPLVIKAAVLPSKTTAFIQSLIALDPQVSIQAHAGNGIVIARFSKLQPGEFSRLVLGKLQPAARTAGGHLVVLSCSEPAEITRPAVWGSLDIPGTIMAAIKKKFDPKGILNPGRFVY